MVNTAPMNVEYGNPMARTAIRKYVQIKGPIIVVTFFPSQSTGAMPMPLVMMPFFVLNDSMEAYSA